MAAKADDESKDEWLLLAYPYQDVLLPRFQPLYNTIASIIVNEIQLNRTKDKYKLLDYGTGPGEPVLTILQLLETNQLLNVELRGSDTSSGMLSLAQERLNKLKKQCLTVQFSRLADTLNLNMYDIITSSLVLTYASDKGQMLRELYMQLKPNGLLITSHWPHPSKVPFLEVLKRVNHLMATGKNIDISHAESDVSFSCLQEEATRQRLITEGFTIDQWISVHLPMSFPNIRTLLSFSRAAPWFENEILYSKAEEETKRILCEDYDLQLEFNSLFELPSTVIVVVASKSRSKLS